MSLLHGDNFSLYGSNANKALMLNGIYADITGCDLIADPDGLSPGFVLRPGWNGLNNNNDNWRYAFQSGSQEIAGVALRLWQTALPGGSGRCRFIDIRNAGNATMAAISVDPTGTLTVITFDTSGDQLNAYTTDVPVITATGWYHIEFKYVHDTANVCSFEIRVEGQTVLTEDDVPDGGFTTAGVPNGAAQAAAHWSQITGPTVYYIKDLVIWDGAGAQDNDFFGSVLVAELDPTADVQLNWTPVGGAAGWSILDNIPPNDAIYLSAPYAAGAPPNFPNPYIATMSDLPVDATSVKGIITYVRAAKSDGGDGSLQVSLISGVDVADGADRPITVAQTYWRDVFELDPATDAPWTPGAVNAAQLQLNRTS